MKNFDVVICGGGAAGLTAGIYAARSGKRCVILDRGDSQLLYAARIENMPGFVSAGEGADGYALWSVMQKQAADSGAAIRAEVITSIDLAAKTVTTAKSTYHGARIVLCLGRRARGLELPGEKALIGHGVSFCALCDGGLYRGKPVAVIGGGNTAFHDALYLSQLGANVTLIHRRTAFTAEPARVRQAMERENCTIRTPYQPVAYCTDRFPDGITEETDAPGDCIGIRLQNRIDGGCGTELLPVRAVFVAVGQRPNTDIPGLSPITDDNGYIETDKTGKTAFPDVYAAGDVRKNALCQIITACASGAAAVE